MIIESWRVTEWRDETTDVACSISMSWQLGRPAEMNLLSPGDDDTPTLWKVAVFYSPKPYRKSSIAVLVAKVKSRNLPESERATDNCCCSVSESTITHRAPVTVMIQLKTTFMWTWPSDQLHCKQRLTVTFKVRVKAVNTRAIIRDDLRFLYYIHKLMGL